MSALSLVELTRGFGNVAAVDRLSLEVASGELVALLGPSGCGKTTTMRMVAGLLEPSAGDVRFDGQSVVNVPAERRGAVMVFQKHLLFPHLSVAENVGFGLKMRGVPAKEVQRRAAAMLEHVQLGGFEARRPHELSGGQQQRVALARALVVEPKVLLLDEPLANLDANLRLEMRRLIRAIQQEMGITTLFVTHDQEEAVMLADRVALLMEGRLQQVGEPRDFYARPATVRVAQFFRCNNFLPGNKRANEVVTGVGQLVVEPEVAASTADGPVTVMVRPEHVQLCPDLDDPSSNCLLARVVQIVFMGTYTQVELVLGEVRWTAHCDPKVAVAVGDEVPVSLEAIWVVSGQVG